MDAKYAWTLHEGRGTRPSPRNGHAIACVGSCAYLFGGSGVSDREGDPITFGDLYKLELGYMPTWKFIIGKGDVPSAREGHSLTAVGNMLYLLEGAGTRRSA
eukprot:Opistho-1_new@107547